MKHIMSGLASTCDVMNWIESNSCPILSAEIFEFKDDKVVVKSIFGVQVEPFEHNRTIIVSSLCTTPICVDDLLFAYPIEEWHQVTGTQKRICVTRGSEWYCCINNNFYYMSM